MEHLECCRLVVDVVEAPCCGLDLGECRFATLEAEAREPPQRGALEPPGLRLAHCHADGEGVAQYLASDVAGFVSGQLLLSAAAHPHDHALRRDRRPWVLPVCRGPRNSWPRVA